MRFLVFHRKIFLLFQTITCDFEATPAFQLKCFRQRSEKVETSHYRVNVNRFRGRLNIFCVSEKLQADLKCDGWPEIKIALAPVGNIKNNLDESQLQDVVKWVTINRTMYIMHFCLWSSTFHLNLFSEIQSTLLKRIHCKCKGAYKIHQHLD